MNERIVASYAQTLYAQDRGRNIMAADNITETTGDAGVVEAASKSTPKAESTSSSPQIRIPFAKAQEPLEFLSAIRGGRGQVVDQPFIDKQKDFIVEFTPNDNKKDVKESLKHASPVETIIKLDEVIRGSEIVLPDDKYLTDELKRRIHELEQQKKEAGKFDERTSKKRRIKTKKDYVIADTTKEDARRVEEQVTEELTHALRLVQDARSFKEIPITKDQIEGNVDISDQPVGGVPEKDGERKVIGAMGPIPPLTPASAHLEGVRNSMLEIDAIPDVLAKQKMDMLHMLFGEVMRHKVGNPFVWDSTSPEFIDLTHRMQAEFEYLGKLLGEENKDVNEAQQVYYGLTRIPKTREILKNGVPVPPGTPGERVSDRVVSDFVVAPAVGPNLSIDAANELKTLNVAQFQRFKNGTFVPTAATPELVAAVGAGALDARRQREIYQALKTDQDIWVHDQLDKLDLANMDLEQAQQTLAFREFVGAQTDMLGEVAEYARSLQLAYTFKHTFENNGDLKAIFQNNVKLKTTLEVMSKQGYGWNVVVPEIEKFITRKRLAFEGQVSGWREYVADSIQEYKESFELAHGRLPTSDELADPDFIDYIRNTLGQDHATGEYYYDLLKQAAEGLYVYELNADGRTVKNMQPKTAAEIETDKFVLGKDKWKAGGFVRGTDRDDLGAIRDHMVNLATDYLEAKYVDDVQNGREPFIHEDEISARAKIAAFMGEWLFWRMTGRSAYWGELGGSLKGDAGNSGEYAMFLPIGFQMYMTQESKGTGEVGRKMRQINFGADTRASYMDKYVPGMAGGTNMNVGIFDYYTQYTAYYPGERNPKGMFKSNGIVGLGFDRGTSDWFRRKGLDGDMYGIVRKYESRALELNNQGLDNDAVWERIRDEMSDKEKNMLDEWNNLPIVSLAVDSSKDALDSIAVGGVNGTEPWGDITDFAGEDFEASNEVRGLMAAHDSGFFSNPDARMLGAVAEKSKGRKRMWQRAHLMKAAAVGLVEFKSFWNKKLTGRDNWNAEDSDEFLTDAESRRLITKRTKVDIEKDIYKKIADKGLARIIPFIDSPLVHKIVFNYGKKPISIVWDAILAMMQEFAKRFPGEALPSSR